VGRQEEQVWENKRAKKEWVPCDKEGGLDCVGGRQSWGGLGREKGKKEAYRGDTKRPLFSSGRGRSLGIVR